MTVVNKNSICYECRKRLNCYYEQLLRKDCPYFAQITPEDYDPENLCKVCGHPTNPSGYCRTCPYCGESSGCG